MTVITTDKRTRDDAIPFEATPFTNSGIGTDGTLDAGTIISSSTLITIRCCKPDRGSLVEAALNLQMAVGSALTVKVAIGRFDTDGFNAVASYTQAEIDASHARITGSSSAIASSGSSLLIDGLNIFKEIPKSGSANYSQDGFVLVLQFSRARTGSDSLKRFYVMCSALMGLI